MSLQTPLWDAVWASGPDGTIADWVVADPTAEPNNAGGLQSIDSLGTAILLALFTDAPIPDYMRDEYQYTDNDIQEWHGNNFGIDEHEDKLGSLLYLIERMPLTYDTAKLAEHYAALALQTLIRQKRVTGFNFKSEIDKRSGMLTLIIRAEGGTERSYFAELFPLR